MKRVVIAMMLVLASVANAQDKMKFETINGDISGVVKKYSEATGQKFIIDSTVRGNITILNPKEISFEEAYNQLSDALAINGFAIIKNGEWMTIKNARTAQRDNIPVSTELPTAKPQRMVTWIATLKNTSAMDVMKELRILTSSYGEMTINTKTNQLVITDWSSNLQRVAELIKQIDIPTDKSISKIVADAQKIQKETKTAKEKKENTSEK